MRTGLKIGSALGAVLQGLLLAAAVGCAAQKPPETASRSASTVVDPAALGQVERVRLVSNDQMVRAESEHRLRHRAGPQLAAGDGLPVLSLQLTCGSDFVFMPNELMRPSCNGMDRDGGDYLQQRYTPPDRTLPGCNAAATLTVDGRTVWLLREEAKVQNRGDLLAAADRMVDQFLADWQLARGGPQGGEALER